MECVTGINPNCSETVYRFPKQYFDKMPPEVVEPYSMEGILEPVAGYSQMRPTDGTVCLYFYQTCGGEIARWLEKNKIPYDVQCPFGDGHEDWIEIEESEEEKNMLSDGGHGQFYRRKPYDN